MIVPGVPYRRAKGAYVDRDHKKYGIAIHCTANTASASAEAAYATRRTDGTSAHFFADRDTVIQSLDTEIRAGHAGAERGNENAVAVEIVGLASWTRERWRTSVCWEHLGRVLAQVCRHHGIFVRRVPVAEMRASASGRVNGFYSHNDMRLAWGGTDHTDPGPGFPWDILLDHVQAALQPHVDPAPTAPRRGTLMMLGRTKSDETVWLGDGMRRRQISTMTVVEHLVAAGAVWLPWFLTDAELAAVIGPVDVTGAPPVAVP